MFDKKLQILSIRRFQALDNIKNNAFYKSKEYNSSLIFRYLQNYSKLFGDEAVGVDIEAIGFAIDTYYKQGQVKAFEYIDYFENFDENTRLIFKSIASGFKFAPEELQLKTFNKLDASVFTPLTENFQHEEIEGCYRLKMERLLGHSIPFDRDGISTLFSILIPHMAHEVPSNLHDLKDYLFEFVSVLWPLFTPRVLKLAYDYLDCKKTLPIDEITNDYIFFKFLGFQKILSRLIVLRAVNGNEDDRSFLSAENIWEDTGFDVECITRIKGFIFDNEVQSFTVEKLKTLPPIERAINLAIYVYSSKHHYQMVERVLEAYEIDNEAVFGLNWDVIYNQFQNIEFINKPSMVALAAMLTNERIRSRFDFVKNQYGLGGAASDLASYCEYCLLEKKTLYQFLNSFSVLGTNSFNLVINFILESVDEISNLYSSDRVFLKKSQTRQNSVLLVKRDCVVFAERKNVIQFWEAEEILSEIRRNFRQRKYEQIDGEGKLVIDNNSLALQIYRWLGQHEERLTLMFEIQDERLRELRLGALTLLLAPELGRFLCYSDGPGVSNKLAFDIHLGNKLRHNILSMRFEDNVQSALPEGLKRTLVYGQLKAIIDEVIDGFGMKWIAIDDSRSFLMGLNAEIRGTILNWDYDSDETLMPLAKQLSQKALGSFSELLSCCRKAWATEYQEEMIEKVSGFLDKSDRVSQRVSDQIIDAIQSSFKETYDWINLNRSKYADNIDLTDLIRTEVTQIKRQPKFRRSFSLSTFLSADDYKKKLVSKKSLKVSGDLVDPIVTLVDNLIFNACKHSGLGVNTPFKIDIVKQRDGFKIVASNEYNKDDYVTISSKLNDVRRELSNPLVLERLREKKGTGFCRIRFAFENVVGQRFSISIPKFTKSQPVKIECTIPKVN